MMKYKKIWLVGIFLSMLVMTTSGTVYTGIVGDYKSYGQIGTFSMTKTNQTMNGVIQYNSFNRKVHVVLLPVPPSVPTRPGLFYGYVSSPHLILLRGIVLFFGVNQSHIYGSWSCGRSNGWFAGDLTV